VGLSTKVDRTGGCLGEFLHRQRRGFPKKSVSPTAKGIVSFAEKSACLYLQGIANTSGNAGWASGNLRSTNLFSVRPRLRQFLLALGSVVLALARTICDGIWTILVALGRVARWWALKFIDEPTDALIILMVPVVCARSACCCRYGPPARRLPS
jgi:hypothetical protein